MGALKLDSSDLPDSSPKSGATVRQGRECSLPKTISSRWCPSACSNISTWCLIPFSSLQSTEPANAAVPRYVASATTTSKAPVRSCLTVIVFSSLSTSTMWCQKLGALIRQPSDACHGEEESICGLRVAISSVAPWLTGASVRYKPACARVIVWSSWPKSSRRCCSIKSVFKIASRKAGTAIKRRRKSTLVVTPAILYSPSACCTRCMAMVRVSPQTISLAIMGS